MAKKSSLIGLFGLFLAIMGITFFLSGISYGMVALLLGFLGLSLDILATLSLFGLVLGAVFFAFGMKIFFENETAFLKLVIGFVGIGLIISGVIVGIVGSVAGAIGIFSLLILWSLGFSLVAYGFKINALKPLNNLISSFKKLLGVKGDKL